MGSRGLHGQAVAGQCGARRGKGVQWVGFALAATVATHFGVPLITVSRLERGHQRNDTLANNYRQWLTAA
jgi:hypothetical protein